MEWMILPLKRYADFRGRSRRMEFWMFQLFYWIVTLVLVLMIVAAFPWEEGGLDYTSEDFESPILLVVGIVVYLIFYLVTLVPFLAVTVRRLHDRGLSGWWYGGLLILGFVPFVGAVTFPGYLLLLVFLCLPSQEGPNKWGPSPFDPGMASVFE